MDYEKKSNYKVDVLQVLATGQFPVKPGSGVGGRLGLWEMGSGEIFIIVRGEGGGAAVGMGLWPLTCEHFYSILVHLEVGCGVG